jgi:hypothetical protein
MKDRALQQSILKHIYRLPTHEVVDICLTYKIHRFWLSCYGRPQEEWHGAAVDDAAYVAWFGYARHKSIQPSSGDRKRPSSAIAGHASPKVLDFGPIQLAFRHLVGLEILGPSGTQ